MIINVYNYRTQRWNSLDNMKSRGDATSHIRFQSSNYSIVIASIELFMHKLEDVDNNNIHMISANEFQYIFTTLISHRSSETILKILSKLKLVDFPESVQALISTKKYKHFSSSICDIFLNFKVTIGSHLLYVKRETKEKISIPSGCDIKHLSKSWFVSEQLEDAITFKMALQNSVEIISI